jgi:hypothetical protein
VGAAGLIRLTDGGNRRTVYSAIGDSLGCEMLTRRLSWHDHIAWPIKSQNLPVTVLEKANRPNYTLDDFDLLGLLLPFPEERAAAWNK